MKLYLTERFSKNSQMSNFTKIRPVGAKLFHTHKDRERHDEVNRYSHFCERAGPPENLTTSDFNKQDRSTEH
jgi:hypothetical protein